MPDRSTTPSYSAIPRIASSTMFRTDLFTRLDSLAPLAVLHGLSGSGKTTLAASWAAERRAAGDLVCWFNAADIPDPHVAVHALRDAPSEKHVGARIVVLDDAHYLTDAETQAALIEALVHSADAHLVICTRIAHDLTQLASAAMLETMLIAGVQLNITPAQIPEFARSWGHQIGAARARELYDAFGGWLGGLRRALDYAHPEYDQTGFHAVSSYLREDILPLIGDEKTLLSIMAVAATGYVAEPLLRVIFQPGAPAHPLLLGRSVSDLLEDMFLHGFIEPIVTDDRAAWRYPTLLATILTNILDTDHPELALHVHRTAANWLAAQPAFEEDQLGGLTASHARAAGDWGLLARLWREHGLYISIKHPHQADKAYHDIPDQIIVQHPELALAASVISALGPGVDDPRRHRLIRNYGEAGWVMHALPLPPEKLDVLETTAQIVAARYFGNVLDAQRLAAEYAERHLVHRSSQESLLHRAWFYLQWGITEFAARNASEAINLFTVAEHYARVAGADAIVSATAAQLALINAVAGHTRTSREHLTDHRQSHNENQWLHHPIRAVGQVAQGILLLDQLDPAAADYFDIPGSDYLEEWALLAWARTQNGLLFGDPILALAEVNRISSLHHDRIHPDSNDRRVLDRCLADLYLALGEFNRCQRHIQDAGADQFTLAVPQARLAFICGDYPTAGSIAATHAWDSATTPRDRIDLVILKAASHLRMGDRNAAKKLFTRAHHLAADADSLTPYAVLPADLRDELLSLLDQPLAADAIARIDLTMQPYPDRGELVTLTPRELVVLHAMLEYETLADIADVLVVSLNTVKKQAHAVHAKLGVHDRQAALLQAHRLGILPIEQPVGQPRGQDRRDSRGGCGRRRG